MRKIYDKNEIAAYIAQSKYQAVLDTLNVNFYLINIRKANCYPRLFRKIFFFKL